MEGNIKGDLKAVGCNNVDECMSVVQDRSKWRSFVTMV